jgi:tetratricopeptide (TPR) repeat protein
MARVTLHEYLDEARLRIEEGAYDDAISICRHILQRYPRHVRTYQILGEACLEKGDFEEAADIFERLLQQADPESFVAHAGLGILREEQGRMAEAIWHMERAFEVAPSNDQVRNALRRLYGKRDGQEPMRIKHNKAALARLYLRGGQYHQATGKFRELLHEEGNEERMDLRLALTEALWRDGRREQAMETATTILETVPHCLKAILILGLVHIEKGMNEQAHEILLAARGLDPENGMAESLLDERSPLAPQVVKIPRLQEAAAEVLPLEAAESEKTEEPSIVAAPQEVPPTEAEPQTEAVSEAPPQPSEEVGEEIIEQLAPAEEEAPTPIIEESPSRSEAVLAEAPLAESVAEVEQPEPEAALLEAEAVAETLPQPPEEVVEEVFEPNVEELEPPPEGALAAAPAAEFAAEVQQPEPDAAFLEQETVGESEPLEMPESTEEEAAIEEIATAPVAIPTPPPEVDRYKQQLERDPKNDQARLALARAYRDLELIQPALEQYGILKRTKADLLVQVVKDMESIVASRPDNLHAHELLADLYVKNGQLQQAVERYRWVLLRLEDRTAS